MINARTIVSTSLVALSLAGCGGASPRTEGPPSEPGPPVQSVPPGPPQPPPPAGVKRYDAATLYKNLSIDVGGFSHDGSKLLVATNASGIFNLYAYPTDGGAPVRLTTSTESQFAVSYFPADDRVLYSQNIGGNELDHLYVLDGATAKDLTPGDKVKARFVRWSRDGASFWVATNERDPKAFDLYRYNTKNFQRDLAFTNKGAWSIGSVSPDGRWLALGKPRNNVDSDIFLVDLKKPAAPPKLITAHKGDVQHGVIAFAPDSKRLWFSTNGHGEFTQAWSYDLATRKARAEVKAEWDVQYVAFSHEGR